MKTTPQKRRGKNQIIEDSDSSEEEDLLEQHTL